jgi:hypothetical protein
MEYSLEQIAAFLASRDGSTRWGIGAALQYIKSVHGYEASDLFAKELASAAERLTYCNAEMEVKSFNDGTSIADGAILEYDAVITTKQKDRDGDVLESSGLELDPRMPVLWQHLQMQPIGKMLRVLEHNESHVLVKNALADVPLGRDAAVLVKFGALRKSIGFKPVAGYFAPLSFTKDANGQDKVTGWHIKKAGVFENSLVSIPANSGGNITTIYEKSFDGIATAYSRDLLKTDAVKSWAKSIYEQRPTQVSGASLTIKSGDFELTIKNNGSSVKCPHCGTANDLTGVESGMDLSKHNCSICGKPLAEPAMKSSGEISTKAGKVLAMAHHKKLKSAMSLLKEIDDAASEEAEDEKLTAGLGKMDLSKSFDESHAKHLEVSQKMYGMDSDYLDGSFEQTRFQLSQAAKNYLVAKGVDMSDSYVDVSATFPDFVVLCVSSYSPRKLACYQVSYSMVDGKPAYSGELKEVEIKPQIIEKTLADMEAKNAAPAPPTMLEMSRKLAASLLTSDGPNGEAKQSFETVSKAFSTLRQSTDDFDLSHLFN